MAPSRKAHTQRRPRHQRVIRSPPHIPTMNINMAPARNNTRNIRKAMKSTRRRHHRTAHRNIGISPAATELLASLVTEHVIVPYEAENTAYPDERFDAAISKLKAAVEDRRVKYIIRYLKRVASYYDDEAAESMMMLVHDALIEAKATAAADTDDIDALASMISGVSI